MFKKVSITLTEDQWDALFVAIEARLEDLYDTQKNCVEGSEEYDEITRENKALDEVYCILIQ